jgi:hypothetical protein
MSDPTLVIGAVLAPMVLLSVGSAVLLRCHRRGSMSIRKAARLFIVLGGVAVLLSGILLFA